MNEKQPARRFVVTEIIEQTTTQKGNRYITCRLEGESEHLAIWGTVGKNMTHVNAFNERARKGFPVILESEWIAPTARFWADEHGHRYWAYEGYAFRILN
jgi:hypothetical protein